MNQVYNVFAMKKTTIMYSISVLLMGFGLLLAPSVTFAWGYSSGYGYGYGNSYSPYYNYVTDGYSGGLYYNGFQNSYFYPSYNYSVGYRGYNPYNEGVYNNSYYNPTAYSYGSYYNHFGYQGGSNYNRGSGYCSYPGC